MSDAGLDVWLDFDELQHGDQWMSEIEKALESTGALAVYVGKSGGVSPPLELQ